MRKEHDNMMTESSEFIIYICVSENKRENRGITWCLVVDMYF